MTVSAIFAVFSRKKRCIDLEQTLLNYMDIDVLDENLNVFNYEMHERYRLFSGVYLNVILLGVLKFQFLGFGY